MLRLTCGITTPTARCCPSIEGRAPEPLHSRKGWGFWGVSIPTFAIGDTVEVGPAYRMGGTLRPDEFTGRRGIVSQVSTDGDVEIDYGRTLWVFHQSGSLTSMRPSAPSASLSP
jgi:hypothetical protein